MKHTFNPNKFNVFTIVPDEFDRNKRTTFKEKTINTCIDSWEKIPNTDIHIFTTQDIKDTFPGMVENDKQYTKSITSKMIKVICDNGNEYTFDPWFKGESCFSTDELRYKLAKEIPNSIYMDSDIYVFDPTKLIDDIKKNENYMFESTAGFSIKNHKLLSEIINVYETKLEDFLFFDSQVFHVIAKKYINFKKYETIKYSNMSLTLHCTEFKLSKFDPNEVKINNLNVIDSFKTINNVECYVFIAKNGLYTEKEILNHLKNIKIKENVLLFFGLLNCNSNLFNSYPSFRNIKNSVFMALDPFYLDKYQDCIVSLFDKIFGISMSIKNIIHINETISITNENCKENLPPPTRTNSIAINR